MTDLLERVRAALTGRYEVEREIGRGGMAVVFLARDAKHGRRVALKVLEPGLAAVVGADRFLREIEIAARLQHPHIVPLFDSGEAGGLLYFVMPFVEGESLGERLEREGALPTDDAIRIARQVALALAYAHRNGIVHRDVKPGNILLSGGAAMVTDFGIARALGEASTERLTATGIAVGSPRYMSPEQAGADEPDERSDVYSLGCVLYEMLTGRPPFDGSSFASILGLHATEPVPAISGTRGPVPYPAERALHRALRKRPEDRFPDADAFAQGLARAPGWRGRAQEMWTDLWRRRVPQTLVTYLVATWIVVLVVRTLVDRLALSPHLPGLALIALLALLPSAAIVGYYHGGTGRTWPAPERVGVALNVVGAGTLMFLLYWGKDLGRATRLVAYTDPAGRTVEQIVPKEEFRRRLAVFYFAEAAEGESDAWLAYAIPYALEADLAQDLMVDARIGFEEEIRRAGVAERAGVSPALARRLAAESGYSWAYSGDVVRVGDSVRVETRLLDVRRGRVYRRRVWTVAATGVLALVDRMSRALREDLGIPSGYMDEIPDLAAADLLTSDTLAYRLYVAGRRLRESGADAQRAVVSFHGAVAADSTFALAWNELSLLALETGDAGLSLAAKESALAADWRLPENRRLQILQGYYIISGRLDDALDLARTRVRLLPGDAEAHRQLAELLVLRREPAAAATEYERLHELQPDQPAYLRLAARSWADARDTDRATARYREWRRAAGETPAVLGEVAGFFQRSGLADSARAYFDRAVLLDPDRPDLLRGLASVQIESGRFDDARGVLERALRAADSPDETFEVQRDLAALDRALGHLHSARTHAEAAYRAAVVFQHGLQLDLTRLEMLDLVALTDGPELALQEVARIRGELPTPFQGLAAYGPFRIYLALEDADALAEAIPAFREGAGGTPFGAAFADRIKVAEGHMARWQGDCAAAAARYEEALTLRPGDPLIQVWLARARTDCGDLAGAAQALALAERRIPTDPRADVARARLLAAAGDTAAARVAVAKALRVWEGSDETYPPAAEARSLSRALAGSG